MNSDTKTIIVRNSFWNTRISVFDGEKNLCPCFDEKFINEIPRVKEEIIKLNENEKSENRQSKIVKKLSNCGLKRGSLHDTTLLFL